MLVDLITITSRDGMTLDGIFCEPKAGVTPQGPVDAMLLIHGSGGSFYRVATKAMAEDLRNQGYACLAINTKGHDTVWSPRVRANTTATPWKFWTTAATTWRRVSTTCGRRVTATSAFWATAWGRARSATTPHRE